MKATQQRVCAINGCGRKWYARDWCKTHYKRWLATGDTGPVEIRIFRKGCKVEGCNKPHAGLGYCELHYSRLRRNGDPGKARPYIRGDDRRRILSRVDKNGPVPTYRPELGPCWIWTSPPNDQGYAGVIAFEGRQSQAHRAAYIMFRGPIPDDLVTDHLCRVRNCVNPGHLEPVTSQINTLRGETIAAAEAARTNCPCGREYDLIDSAGKRRCSECRRRQCREATARYRARKKDAAGTRAAA